MSVVEGRDSPFHLLIYFLARFMFCFFGLVLFVWANFLPFTFAFAFPIDWQFLNCLLCSFV